MLDYVYDLHSGMSVPFHEAFEIVYEKLLEKKILMEEPYMMMTGEELEEHLSDNLEKYFEVYGYLFKEYY